MEMLNYNFRFLEAKAGGQSLNKTSLGYVTKCCQSKQIGRRDRKRGILRKFLLTLELSQSRQNRMPGLSFDALVGPKGTEVIKAALGGVETGAGVLILSPRLMVE